MAQSWLRWAFQLLSQDLERGQILSNCSVFSFLRIDNHIFRNPLWKCFICKSALNLTVTFEECPNQYSYMHGCTCVHMHMWRCIWMLDVLDHSSPLCFETGPTEPMLTGQLMCLEGSTNFSKPHVFVTLYCNKTPLPRQLI